MQNCQDSEQVPDGLCQFLDAGFRMLPEPEALTVQESYHFYSLFLTVLPSGVHFQGLSLLPSGFPAVKAVHRKACGR